MCRSGKKLREVPESVLENTRLTGLNLSFNDLAALPGEIGNLLALTELRYARWFFLFCLILRLRGCGRVWYSNFKNRAFFHPPPLFSVTDRLSSNHIHALPMEIGRLKNLAHLAVNNNRLTSIPDTIGQCTLLAYLDLSFNQVGVLLTVADCCGLLWTVVRRYCGVYSPAPIGGR